MMSLPSLHVLNLATGGLWLLTAGVCAWTIGSEFGLDSSDHETAPSVPVDKRKLPAQLGLAQFAPIWEQRLAPVAPNESTVAKSLPAPGFSSQLRLQGIVLEAGRDRAIFTDGAGNIDVRGIDGELRLVPAGMTIKNITPDQVVIEWQGRSETFKLQLPAEK